MYSIFETGDDFSKKLLGDEIYSHFKFNPVIRSNFVCPGVYQCIEIVTPGLLMAEELNVKHANPVHVFHD